MSKFIIITGGSRGIGLAITKLFLKNSYSVVYTYIKNNDAYEELDSIAKTNNAECISYKLDVSDPIEVSGFYNWFCEKNFEIVGLVNNAGIAKDGIFVNMSDENWDEVIKVNLYGTFYMCREFSKIMMLQGKGFIINIASTTGLTGSKGAANYAASKGGVIALSKSIGMELARFGIRVNVVAPGFIQTDMISGLSSKKIESIKKNLMMNRLGDPDEVAELVLFLAKGKHFFQNSVLETDGGKII